MSATPEEIERWRIDTVDHIAKVQAALTEVTSNLTVRAAYHDESKLREPELSGYAALRARLSEVKYGTPEYKAALEEGKEPISAHYAANSHHPEHWVWPVPESEKAEEITLLRKDIAELEKIVPRSDGSAARCLNRMKADLAVLESRINAMSLLDIIEMFCDWYAAGQRTKEGSLKQSLEVNRTRFGADPVLAQIFENTRIEMGWE